SNARRVPAPPGLRLDARGVAARKERRARGVVDTRWPAATASAEADRARTALRRAGARGLRARHAMTTEAGAAQAALAVRGAGCRVEVGAAPDASRSREQIALRRWGGGPLGVVSAERVTQRGGRIGSGAGGEHVGPQVLPVARGPVRAHRAGLRS